MDLTDREKHLIICNRVRQAGKAIKKMTPDDALMIICMIGKLTIPNFKMEDMFMKSVNEFETEINTKLSDLNKQSHDIKRKLMMESDTELRR